MTRARFLLGVIGTLIAPAKALARKPPVRFVASLPLLLNRQRVRPK